jgi:hypothetical protein
LAESLLSHPPLMIIENNKTKATVGYLS